MHESRRVAPLKALGESAQEPRVEVPHPRGLRRRVGTGPSGKRNEYLWALVARFDDAMAARVMSAYDTFASDLAGGLLPDWYYAAQSMANLLPLVKKALTMEQREAGETPDVRPVAIGEVEPRAIMRSLTEATNSAFMAALAPQQR